MAKPTYYELLRHPNWQAMRLRVMERARFACERCDDRETTLNVHHTYYEKGLKPWEYPAESLRCLCEPCHKLAELQRVLLNRAIGLLDDAQIEELTGYAKALCMEENPKKEIEADSYQEIVGMVRLFAMLNHYEIGRHVSSVLSVIDEGKVSGDMLLGCREEVAVIDGVLAGKE